MSSTNAGEGWPGEKRRTSGIKKLGHKSPISYDSFFKQFGFLSLSFKQLSNQFCEKLILFLAFLFQI